MEKHLHGKIERLEEKIEGEVGELLGDLKKLEKFERQEHLGHHGHHHHHHEHPHKEELVFIINGKPYEVEAAVEGTLKLAVEEALKKSKNTARPIDDWNVTWNGQRLDKNRLVKDFHFPRKAELFLSVNAGEGGGYYEPGN